MLYTVTEISDLINLSKVSIYNKLKLKELQNHINKKAGVTYVDEEGFNLIKDSLKLKDNTLNDLNIEDTNITLDDEISTDTDNLG